MTDTELEPCILSIISDRTPVVYVMSVDGQ